MNINTKSRIAFYSSNSGMVTILSLIYPNTIGNYVGNIDGNFLKKEF